MARGSESAIARASQGLLSVAGRALELKRTFCPVHNALTKDILRPPKLYSPP